MITHILTDIEGTTSSISFVHETLFPYSRFHMRSFIRENFESSLIQPILSEIARDSNLATYNPETIANLLDEMVQKDLKYGPLKALQGMIWEKGYDNGSLTGHVYQDVPQMFRSWTEAGLTVSIYSSGSIKAQKLLFKHTEFGDLTRYISNFFDTTVGPKIDVLSYQKISQNLKSDPKCILFLSDIERELEAAREAGMTVCQLFRTETSAQKHFVSATNFQEINSIFSL